jgi:hypothetical protein
MAEDRMMRASLRSSEVVNSWPIPLRFFWTQLWGYCDSWGRGRYDTRLIKADAFPLDDEVDAEMVGRWMQALEMSGVIVRYEVSARLYFFAPGWDDSQSIRYKKKSDIPEPSAALRKAAEKSARLGNVSLQGEVEVEVEGEGESAHVRPPVDNSEPSQYCNEHPTGTTSKCGLCGDARRAHGAWERARKNRPTVVGIITPDDCPKHPHRPLIGCDRCAEEAVAS